MERKILTRAPNQAEERRKRVCLEQLTQDRHRLLMRWPFIGGIIMRMELIPVRDDRLGTAATDGDNIFVDVDFYAKLKQDERLFVLAHEIWHCVFLHFARRQDRDHRRFNIAADLEIHFALKDERMSEPFVLPHDPCWQGLSAEEIYELLPKSPEKKEKGAPSEEQEKSRNEAFGSGEESFDKHVYPGDAAPEVPEGNVAADASSNDGAPGNGALVVDSDYAPRVTETTVEHARARAIASAQQIERAQGTLPAEIKRLLEFLQKPSLPWQELLKQFVTICYGGQRRWLPPSRRHVWQDLYLPSMCGESLRAVVALDTSGSTSNDLPVFFAELVSLMRSFGKFDLEVIQCDDTIQDVEHYTQDRLPPPDKKWKVKGGGGTDFRPVFEYVKTHSRANPDLMVFFTDGYGSAPDRAPAYPVMWILTNDGKTPVPWGRVAHLE